MSITRRELIAGTAVGAGWLASSLPLAAIAQAQSGTGGALNIALFPEPTSIMVGWGQTGPSQLVNGNIYDGLLRYDEKLNPMPGLASAWTISKDSLVYTFTLKRGVTWHDGKPFDAQDVIFSIDKLNRAQNPRVRVALQSVESIKALDAHTVEIRLKEVFAPFIGLFDVSTNPIAPRHLLENTDLTGKPPPSAIIGTGPYKFKEWVRGSYIHLVGNDKYHEPSVPKIDNVYFQVIPDAASRAAAFESGKIDVLPGGTIEYFDVARLAKLPGAAVTSKGWEKFSPLAWMWINHRNPLFQDLRMRQAIELAIDRDALSKVVWQGFAPAATGPFNRQTAFYSAAAAQPRRDKDKARKLLAESGYKGQPVRLLGLPFGEAWNRTAELIRQNLLEAGLKVELVATDLAGAVTRASNWDFDLALTYMYQYGDPALGVSRNYVSSEIKKGSAFNNVGGYQNAKVDAMFYRAAGTTDPKKRLEAYSEAQKTLVDDVAAVWLLDLNFPTVYRTKIANLVNSGIGLNDSLGRASFTGR
ncbi:ABC transporter substrate-binding protein [Polaromonas sp. C04]|uniref:ABC transporter substrate-binding protein n=1 Tax=Polaromonas sp. C04 TaxID=1945857 RepID=UPI001185338A|nr:ABC transporter substrate-binding protein [Polaromonas sp. C04]